MAELHTKQYSRLELFAESLDGTDGVITLTGPEGEIITEHGGTGYYRWIQIPLKKHHIYQISWSGCRISQCYLSGNDDMLDEGVCFLELKEEVREIQGEALHTYYDTSYREQYHFNPYKNWINDPNGLCWFKGRYHLFYQANPHEQKWDDMYWGHAVSRDLVHWVHLPHVLEPQEELLGDPIHKGGAFSGCAVPFEDEVVFYLTRHYGEQEDGPSTIQWQNMMKSRDMISFTKEKEIIREKPEGVGHDFRDPKVVRIKDSWYMVLAANLNGESAILLYRSEDMEHWEYKGPLVVEPDPGSVTFECPDFFPLDGTYVAAGALMGHVDEYGRYQMTRYYTGDFSGGRLQVKQTGWFDFGSNYYAVQSFLKEGRRIAIGWVSDFYGEHRAVTDGAYGSFAIPRELHVRNGRLFMQPVREIYQLLDKTLYSGSGMAALEKIPGNSYYVKLKTDGGGDFKLTLAREKERSITFEVSNGVAQIRTYGGKTADIRFPAGVKIVTELEIFVDRRTVEVYVNGGEAAGTKVFYTDQKDGCYISEFEKPEEVKQMEVYAMKSIW